MNTGWNIAITGFEFPVNPTKLYNNENYYTIEEVNEMNLIHDKEWIIIRVLGLEGQYVASEDADTFNDTIIEYPFMKHQFNFNSYPLDVLDNTQMEIYYKLLKLKPLQYKYMRLEGEDINNQYPILNPIPEGMAMLFSMPNDWTPTFNYENANRRLRNIFTSYFSQHIKSLN